MSTKPWWAPVAPNANSIVEVVDPEIATLPETERAELARIWQKRGEVELRVASTFSSLAVELFEHGAPAIVYEKVGQAVRDEVNHAQISIDIASRYRGDAPIWPEPGPNNVPVFKPTTGPMHATIYVVTQCCLNETLACAGLEASSRLTTSGLIRAGNRSILADEIEHARIGWAYLSSHYVTPPMRSALSKWLPRLLAGGLQSLVDEDGPVRGEEFASQGILSLARKREIATSTLAEVMFPGFERAGIDTSLAREWARDTFERAGSSPVQGG